MLYRWSPRKHGGGSHTSLQAGQILYFTSGFLTIQLEIQNFLSLYGIGEPIYASHALESASLSLAGIPFTATREIPLAQAIAETILNSTTTNDLFHNLHNMSSQVKNDSYSFH